MTVEDDLVRLARAHQSQLLTIRASTSTAIGALWDRLVVNVTDDVFEQFTVAGARLLVASQSTAAAAVVAFVQQSVRVAGEAPEPVTPDLAPSAFVEPRGVPVAQVLGRSIVQVRRGLAAGKPYDVAVLEGRARAVQTGATEPMLAARQASQAAMAAQPRIVGYRRVPDADACKFCLLAATRRYVVADLMPIHPSCGCTTAPIIGRRDPGGVLDRGLVDQLMAADPALGKRGADRDIARRQAAKQLDDANRLITVHEHGELGPTLYQSGLSFEQI